MIERIPAALPEHGTNGNGHQDEAPIAAKVATLLPWKSLSLPGRLTEEEAQSAFDVLSALLAEASAEDAQFIGEFAEALRRHTKRRRLGVGIRNAGLRVVYEADLTLVEEAEPHIRHGGDPDSHPKTLADYGMDKYEWARLRALRNWGVESFDRWLAQLTRRGEEATKAGAIAEAQAFAKGFEAGAAAAREAAATANALLARYQAGSGSANADIRDLFQTPAWALDCILEYIPRDWRVWECASGPRRNLARALAARGNPVISTDIVAWDGETQALDFLREQIDPDSFDLILTNPPFSYKDLFLARCFWWWESFAKPFWLLMPATAIAEQGRLAMYSTRGIDLVLPPRRINYETPVQGLTEDTGSSSWQFTGWFGRGSAIPPEDCGGRVIFPRELAA